MKRLYTAVATRPVERGWGVTLDGRPLRTPARREAVLPSEVLAAAIAAEWEAQQTDIRPPTMPLFRLAATALDRTAVQRDLIIRDTANYAGTDLVCYRAGHPPELVARQHEAWQPLIDWASLRYDAPLEVTAGVVPITQAPSTLRAFAAAVGAHRPLELAALHLATAACGSLVVALALIEGRLDAEGAFNASQLDETFEIEQWGEDAEQMRRRAALKEDMVLAERFIALLRS